MEIRVLRYFLAVAREESITRAAEILHITQPTLSRQLAQMEEEMGIRLFDRGTRKVTLTEEGLLLRRRAEEILELVDKTEKELTEQETELEGTVSIGCGDLGALHLLSDLIRKFQKQHPAVRFDLYTAEADTIRDRMERGLADLGLLLEPVNMERFDFIRIGQPERWVAVLPVSSPLAQRASVCREDLAGVPLILPRRPNVQSELASWFGELFDGLNVVMTSNLPSSTSVMVQHGLACALVIQGSVSSWDPRKVVCRPLEPPLLASSVLAWKHGQPFGAAAERFIRYLREELA